jgi:hypothetical protein
MFNSALHSILYRTGRSGERIRVSESVVQQEKCRVRASAVEGTQVLVIGGEHRGLIGNIDSAIPGKNVCYMCIFQPAYSMTSLLFQYNRWILLGVASLQ